MDMSFAALASNLLAPTILFFILRLVAAFARSDLSIPEGAAKIMSIYLLLAIGFKGGVAVAESGITDQLIASLFAGAMLSFVLPFVAYMLLRTITQLDPINAAAVAGHYGSISIVTFVTAVSLLEAKDILFEGYLVAVAAVMEVPAIMSALWLAARKTGSKLDSSLFRHIMSNGSIVLLVGSFAIGAITGQDGLTQLKPFIVVPFTGVLYVFLLTTLSASASYIAVPAAMRLALPEAKSGIYLTLSLGVTFPFNLTVGLPLYMALAV